LHSAGILTDDEFSEKKKELLSKLWLKKKK
jgi:hypothetical protein